MLARHQIAGNGSFSIDKDIPHHARIHNLDQCGVNPGNELISDFFV